MNSRLTTYFAACALVVLSALTGGSAEQHELSWFTFGSGGGTSSDGFFGLSGTVGQADAGVMTNADYQIEAGFWAAALRARPFIGAPPASITNAILGTNITFRAPLVGSPPFQFQWQLNGVNLPGETNDTLTITNAQLAQGGAYTWVVANELGVTNSGRTVLQFNLPPWPPAPSPGTPPSNDKFADRFPIALTNMNFSSDNMGATKEAGETNHAGKLGGSSVWYTWSTNADGIATFRTRGSGFDTLLAVYTNSALETLMEVAADDDSDAFLTSQVRFNVSSGTAYQIAVDGLGGREGTFVVSWEFGPTPQKLPLITLQPKNRAVRSDGTAITVFSVSTHQPGLIYQWHFNGNAITDATNAALVLSNIVESDLGFYHVGVTNMTNAVGLGVESRRAALEFGPKESAFSYEKLEDLLLAVEQASMEEGLGESVKSRAASVGGSGAAASVTVSDIDRQVFQNSGSTTSGRCGSCAVIGGAARYICLEVSDSGILGLDTVGSNKTNGSTLDTVLTAYEYSANTALSQLMTNACAYLIGCDDNSAGNKNSRLSFPVVKGGRYIAEVDTVNGATGTVILNWQLYRTPSPFEYVGTNLYLTVDTNLVVYRNEYSWFANGVGLGVTTEPRLLLGGFVVPAVRYDVAMDVQTITNTWSVRRLTNNIGVILTAYSESVGTNFQLVLPGLLSLGSVVTNLQVEAAFAVINSAGSWQWQQVTNFTKSSLGNTQILTFPADNSEVFYRVRPLLLNSQGSR